MRFVCLSDTHGMHDRIKIPDGDVLIHAGDFTAMGEIKDIIRFNKFLSKLPHKHKIVIAGNHDGLFEASPEEARAMLTNCIYLEDSEVTIEGIRIYGSPWTPFCDVEMAFNLPPHFISKKWDMIPAGINVLITHGPPKGYCDRNPKDSKDTGSGCPELLLAVQRIRPKYQVFGHIHRGYGIGNDEHTSFINAATCDEDYRPINRPMVFDCVPATKK